METIDEMVQNLIQLQHQTQLLLKKIDVVGVINAKVESHTTKVYEDIKENKNDIEAAKIQMSETITETDHLTTNITHMIQKHEELKTELHTVKDKLEQIDTVMDESKDDLNEAVEQNQQDTQSQLNALETRIEGLQTHVDDHIQNQALDTIESDMTMTKDMVKTTLESAAQNKKEIDDTINEVQDRLQSLNEWESKVKHLNASFIDLMDRTVQMLSDVDDKVCRLSPIYTGPTAKDLEDSYYALAQHDLNLSSQLDSQFTADWGIQDDNDTSEAFEGIKSIAKSADDTKESHAKEHKKGFLTSFFGGK